MVQLENGFLKEIYDGCFRHFLSGIDPKLHAAAYVGEHPRLGFAETEFAGKYMDTCVQFYRYTGDPRLLEYAACVANSVLANQRQDGYIGGNVRGKEWDGFSVWNQAFTAYGLISVFEETKEMRYLSAAEKTVSFIADHYLSGLDDILNAPNAGSQHLAILIPTARLYAMTKKPLYRDFTEYIFQRMKHSDNNFIEFQSIFELRSKKAIENLCGLIGMAMYAQDTENEEVLSGVQRYWRELADTQINETGNGTKCELWFETASIPTFLPPEMSPNENCVAVGWAELNAQLFAHAPKAEYLDQIEKTLYNHLIGSLDKDCSDFAYYQPNFGKRITRTQPSAYKCCRYRGFSAISQLPAHLFYENGKTVIPMIYTNASFENAHLKIRERTEYPFDNKICFTVSGAGTIKLRIPAWCKQYTLTENGKACTLPCTDGFVTLSGEWSDAEILLDLHTELHCRHSVIYGEHYCQFSYGSVLLVLNAHGEDRIFFTKIDPSTPLERVKSTAYRMEFRINGELHGKPEAVQIVDYATAGKLSKHDEYTVWIKEKSK